ncbi:MAG TPA: elongation factor G [Ktedonobacteraceae bacterium]|nr:elongation factor G [Ktedonobacteraceae bacterium]
MKVYSAEHIRNIALISHVGAGKTSLIDAALYDSGAVTRQGKVDEGSSVADFEPDELKRRMSLHTKVLPVEWKDTKINLIDTPGYADFIGEVKAGLRVADAALVVVTAEKGVEVGTELTWQYADERNLPRVVLVNKLERENTSFENALDSLRQQFGTKVVPLQIPIGEQADFKGVVDLVTQKAYTFEGGNKVQEIPIPANLQDSVNTFREQMIESAVESDDEIMEKFLEGETLSDDEILSVVKTGTRSGQLIPVLCGSALKNIGVQSLLDALVNYLPSAAEAQPEDAQAFGDALSLLVFRTAAAQVGTVSTFRVYSGTLKSDMHAINLRTKTDERLSQLVTPRGKNQEPASEIPAGDFGAVAKLTNTHTGDTLSTNKDGQPLEGINFPAPCYTVALFPKSQADLDKMGNALNRVLEEDRTLSMARDPETAEVLLSGMGEAHLQIVIEGIKRKFNVDLEARDPRISYRETIRKKARANGRHKRQSGGHGQFGDVWLEIEPLPMGGEETFVFEDKIVGGVVPGQFIPGVEKGVRESLKRGFISGNPMVYVKVALVDGKYHPVDSSAQSFEIAASLGMQEAVPQAGPTLLEPIMTVNIVIPESNMGDVMSDINSAKRGRVLGMNPLENGMQQITAHVPQAEMLHYATDLRSITQGRGSFSMEFYEYEEVPANVQQEIIAQHKKSQD